MTEQEKREKVIKGLECCGYTRFMDKCQECPYDGKDCFKRLKTDALALLKAQEPRVMNDSDFINNPNIDSQGFLPAWIEYRRDGEWIEYWDDTDDEWLTVRAENYKGEGHRCWTSRPTDEQREKEPWK